MKCQGISECLESGHPAQFAVSQITQNSKGYWQIFVKLSYECCINIWSSGVNVSHQVLSQWTENDAMFRVCSTQLSTTRSASIITFVSSRLEQATWLMQFSSCVRQPVSNVLAKVCCPLPAYFLSNHSSVLFNCVAITTFDFCLTGHTRLNYPRGMEGWVDLGGWVHTRRFTYQQTVTHPILALQTEYNQLLHHNVVCPSVKLCIVASGSV